MHMQMASDIHVATGLCYSTDWQLAAVMPKEA